MERQDPSAELDPRFSDERARPTPWADALNELQKAMVYWLSTTRPDGRPHVTTIAAVWLDDALHFTTGQSERKARNLETNQHCVVTTGCNAFEGLDIVIEGDAVRVTDAAKLRRLADAYPPKYGQTFVFYLQDGVLHVEGAEDEVLAFELVARKGFGFGKGEIFSQTRWSFAS